MRTDSDEAQELVNRSPLTKNPDKGISLEQEVDPGWKDNQHEPELAVLKLGQKISCRVRNQKRHKSNDPSIENGVEAHLEVGPILRCKKGLVVL